MDDKKMSILEHLDALRRALIISLLALIPGTAIGWFIRERILDILIRPVKSMHYKLVYIGATEAFMAELKIAMFAGVAIALPVIAYQFWNFILPALHSNERRYIKIFVPVSMVMFALGIVFGYYTVFTYGVQFLLSFGGEGLTPMLSLGKYLSFAFWFLLPFGIMFELPLIILLLVRLGIISTKFLTSKRKWVLVGSFVISAVATPTTDMLSQTVMAVAMYLLYEVSIWLSYLVRPSKNKKAKQKEEKESEEQENVENNEKVDEVNQSDNKNFTIVKETAITIDEKDDIEENTEENTEENIEDKADIKTENADTIDINKKAEQIEDEMDSSRLAEIYKQIVEQGKDDNTQEIEVNKTDKEDSNK